VFRGPDDVPGMSRLVATTAVDALPLVAYALTVEADRRSATLDRLRPVLIAALTLSRGRTPGRAVTSLELVHRDGTTPGRLRVAIREAAPGLARQVAWVALRHLRSPQARRNAGCALSFASLVVQARDPEHRSLGDRVAGTRLKRPA
jgi:hypothetical protein